MTVRLRWGALAASLLVPLAAMVPMATAAHAAPESSAGGTADTRELTRTAFTLDGAPVDVPQSYRAGAQLRAAPQEEAQAAGVTPPVGTVRQWLGLDDVQGSLYRKDYTLRGVGTNIEVWVANDIAFPAGDCRGPAATEITDAQVASLVTEFDTTMYPRESAAFSVPPPRDGSNTLIGPDANGNGGDYSGAGDKIVTLVDNVRDDNYYTFPAAPTYIAGFFTGQFNELFDRNVMTIDAFDWLHRTGANPPDEPTADLCTSRPARPRLYEGTFAHEYQHLLQYYTDPFETIAVNEGLSDYAQTLTGYVDSRATVFDRGADSHLYCFQGFGTVSTPFNTNPRDCGGPENSFTLWDEGGNPNAVLADYGHAYSLMLFLADRYGQDIISRLHQDGGLQGLASLDAALDAEGADLYQVLHDHQAMVLTDKILDDAGRRGVALGVPRSRITTPSLRSTVNLDNPAANATPGAAPNGADYVRLAGADGTPLRGRDLRSLTFAGAGELPSQPLAWTVVSDDPDRPGDPVLFSGDGNSIDASAVTEVAVPAAAPTLTFLAKYGAELGFDYGYVEVSTDGGATYTAVPGDRTVDGPRGPALNGTTDGFEPHSYDLSAYAGQTVLLGFRYVSDGGVNEGGLRLDDIAVGGTTISDGSSLEPFSSPTEINPTDVANWHVQLIGIRQGAATLVQQVAFDGASRTLDRAQLARFAPADFVVAVVAYDEPTETVQQYAPYTLTVNGTVQPGGGGAPPAP
ncbi:MAG: immune inhibitor A [Pseudonocardiales bacterium]|nr:immune inhibitor A [Pseudonocardiales bacterium]